MVTARRTCVWRPQEGYWYVLLSSTALDYNSPLIRQWGKRGDMPTPGDFDGDGRADLAVWRPDDGYWYVLLSSIGYNYERPLIQQWGTAGDVPLAGDFDGDGKTDFAVWRPERGVLVRAVIVDWIRLSTTSDSAVGYCGRCSACR